MPKKTFHRGASLERQAFVRKLRALRKICSGEQKPLVDDLLDWVYRRVQRFRKRVSGL